MTIKVTYNVTDVYVTQDVSPVYINVSYSGGGGGGAAVWGGITGTLSNQTDLQSALDAKFDDPTGTSLQYIDGTGALQTFPLTLPVLQQVRNQTGSTLDVGTVVYINGATGNLPTVTKAIATGDATSAQTLGMVSASIANNGSGYVVVIGTCNGLDTSAYTEGQQLYLSGTTAGAVTTTKPYAPIHLVYIGIVTRAHPTLGTIEVRVMNGFELEELHDVDALNPNNNDGLFYNSTTSLWEHKQISTALGYTPANAATTLTINGVTYDLSANRTFTVGSVTGSGASGQVAYWTGASSQSGSNNLFWDAANSRLGIGTNVPSGRLHVLYSVFSDVAIFERTPIFTNSPAGSAILRTGYSSSPLDGAGATFSFQLRVNTTINDIASFGAIRDGADNSGALSFLTFNAGTQTEKMRIRANGNLLLQNGGTFTDTGERLQVTGDVKIVGSGATSGTNALVVRNSSSTALLSVRNDGFVTIPTGISSGYVAVNVVRNEYYNTANNVLTAFRAHTSTGHVSFYNSVAIGTSSAPSASKLNITGLPTSATGLNSGDVWNDLGTLKIV